MSRVLYQILEKVKWILVVNSKTFLQKSGGALSQKGIKKGGIISLMQPEVGKLLEQERLHEEERGRQIGVDK